MSLSKVCYDFVLSDAAKTHFYYTEAGIQDLVLGHFLIFHKLCNYQSIAGLT